MPICVFQSHRSPLPHAWLQNCLASVKAWAESRHYDYRFVGDELFAVLPDDIRLRQDLSPVIRSDLARLRFAESLLKDYQTVIWLDADTLVLSVEGLSPPEQLCSVGRENWIQMDAKGRLRNYRKVHNAAMVFHRDGSLLPFYADSAERLLRANRAGMPAQFIGPKLLSALHNTVQLPVWESAAMMSPLVGLDLLGKGEGRALSMWHNAHQDNIAAVNLCSSSCARGDLSDAEMANIIDVLQAKNRC